MEATLLGSHRFHPSLFFSIKPLKIPGLEKLKASKNVKNGDVEVENKPQWTCGWSQRILPSTLCKTLPYSQDEIDELGDFSAELKLSFFQLGISPQIIASIIMQVLCHVVPSSVRLRKEGLDGHEKIKSYIWWISLGFAIVEAIIVACYSLPYSINAASYRRNLSKVSASAAAGFCRLACPKVEENYRKCAGSAY
ncbi:hypothetical protein REPUB_Repub17cG0095400 [Reevesia pubescens]